MCLCIFYILVFISAFGQATFSLPPVFSRWLSGNKLILVNLRPVCTTENVAFLKPIFIYSKVYTYILTEHCILRVV